LATLAAVSLQNAEWLRKAVEKQRLEWQMGTARLVQRFLLPDPGCGPAWLNWEAYYRPALAVGGDYFDIVPLHDQTVLVVVGDVSDHGIPAALLMTAVRSIVRSECLRGSRPAQILRSVNHFLCEDSGKPQDLLASLFVALVEGNRRELTYANAGHPTPLLWDATRLVPAPLPASGPLLGKCKDPDYPESRLTLGPGYRLFLYSDGLTEAGNPHGELFGLPRIRQVAAEQCGLPGAEFVLRMRRQIETFSECTDPRDDLTMLWLGERAAL
jgi:serine phosphatase RsbU (regulator of sigma subunit)